jgi:hypothetical protein
MAAVLVAGLGVPASSQDKTRDEGTRQLWDDAFTESRPKSVSPKPRPSRRPSAATAELARTGSFVGITVWRLPEGRGVAGGQRTEVDAGLQEGQRVRLSIEASQPGFLYVIDRERYADGSLGEPSLIFPTTRLRGGDNAVQPGRVIEVPDVSDTPPFFTVRRSRPDQVEERLTLLITPTPLAGIEIGRTPSKLTPEQVAEWERNWSAPARKIEAQGGAGRSYSRAELEASQNPNRLLTQEDPLPQTLYRVEARPPKVVLVQVGLKIAKGS